MASSLKHPAVGASLRPRLLLTALLAVCASGLLFLGWRQLRRPEPPPVEAHRSQLELREGRWYAPGQTNGFTGLLMDTYEDGTMKSRSAVSNGFLEGLSTGWYTNGQPQIEEHFRAGVSEGHRTKWYSDGRKLSEATIVSGKLQGTFRRWHDNGQLAEQIEMRSGEPDGVAFAYFPSGSLKAETYVQDGKVLDQKVWKDGERREPPSPDAPEVTARSGDAFLGPPPNGGG